VKLNVSAASHKGYTRVHNEDAILVGDWISHGQDAKRILQLPTIERAFPLVVADGMGGHNAGEVASRIVVEEFRSKIAVSSDPSSLTGLLWSASKEIHKQSAENTTLAGMGATIVGAIIQTRSVTIFNVGDSRAYLASEGNFQQISVDDVLPGARGSRSAPLRHAVTQAFGGSIIRTRPRPHMRSVPARPSSLLLLCSDGLTDMVTDEKIAKLLLGSRDPAEALVDAALEAGGVDNVSVIVASFLS
jgi:serine/threonine protein phosphatase PrpC